MKKVDFNSTEEYLKFVDEFHITMSIQKILLAYEGKITHDVIIAFTQLAEENINLEFDDESIQQKVYHVMVECLQNICKHAYDENTGNPAAIGQGIFMVGLSEKDYNVTTGNAITNADVEKLKSSIDNINAAGKDELKALYRKKMFESRLTDEGNAGLGLIDMARKTGEKIEYYFRKINDKTSFFLLNIKIPTN